MTDDRLLYWRRHLGRLLLNPETLAEQVDRHRRTTWGLTAVALFVAMMFLGLFTAFGHPGPGVAIAAAFTGAIIAAAWARYGRIASRAAAYGREVADGGTGGL